MREFILSTVGQFVGQFALSILFDSLYDRLAVPKFWDFICGEGKGLQANLDKWRQNLQDIQNMVDDAEEKQYFDTAVKRWLDDLKHLAYDVDDIVDELATEAFLAENQARPTKLRKLNILGASSAHKIDSTLLSKIKELTDRFNGIVTRKDKLNLKETAYGRSHGKTEVRATTSLRTEPGHHVYGRDKDKKAILELLVGEKNCSHAQLSVIPILGMGAIGKTALAQLVYNDEVVQKSFDLKAWASISQDFDVDRVTKTILQSLISDNCDGNDRNWLQVKLKEKLEGKKFLVVLDDLGNDDYYNWIILRAPFLVGAPGSKIIITTRNLKVSSMTGTVQAHNLLLLSNNDCLSIFTQHALGASNFSAHSNLQDIGKKIVRRCKGLPLAARTLGGLLRTKKEECDKWEDVLKSKIWDISGLERSGIVPALMLSYHHLPSHLKRCFMYCSILPEGYEFEEQQLVLLWMAEGLIQQPEGDKQMEDLGSEYFKDLLSRSFFQQSSTNKFQYEKPRFVMHDLINNLAKRVAGDICFRMEDEIWGGNPEKVRHSSYLRGHFDIAKKFKPFFEFKCLRTFLPHSHLQNGYWTHNFLARNYLTRNVSHGLLLKLPCLRALSLSGYCIVELPYSIGNLKHLRYLDLSYTQIRGLLESTTTLCNLQTMILKDCSYLKKLPSNLSILVNLRHLNILNAHKLEGMPPQISKLTHLQTLSNLIVAKDSCFTLREIGSLLHLRGTLIISQLENAIEPTCARDAKLIEKPNLTVLCLEWSNKLDESLDRTSEFEVLNMLQPHKALKELTIRCYGGMKFPTWLRGHSFSHMVLLRIENCKMCTSLPPVGQLPSLKHLFIEGMASVKNVGHEFYGVSYSQPFESLETLKFTNMEAWESWSTNQEFRHLRDLSITNCPKLLGKLPNHFPLLKKVLVRDCPRLVVSISSFPELCRLQIGESEGVMRENKVVFNSLNSKSFSTISKFKSPIEGLILKGLTHVEDLAFENSEELTPLWSNDVGLLHPLPNLHVLKFDNCSKLVSLAAEKANKQPQLDLPSTLGEIHISRCNALASLPKEIMYNNTCLERIEIIGCDSLKHFAIGQLPPTLKRLSISFCKRMLILLDEDDINSYSRSTSLLERLDIRHCPSLKSLTASGALPATLKYLYIFFCRELRSIAKSFHHNLSLEEIFIWRCGNLESLPIGMHTLSHLHKIQIFNGPALVSFPDGGLLPGNLRELRISNWEKLQALPNCIHNITSLQLLEIWNCPSVVSFPKEGFPTSLISLEIANCNITEALLEWGLHRLTSLQQLIINGGCPHLVSFQEMMLPASLSSLTIINFPNLKCLSSEGFGNLASLDILRINDCESLASFPENGLCSSLQELYINKCPLLKEHCKKDQGREWFKIAHIPYVEIDGRFIYDPVNENQCKAPLLPFDPNFI